MHPEACWILQSTQTQWYNYRHLIEKVPACGKQNKNLEISAELGYKQIILTSIILLLQYEKNVPPGWKGCVGRTTAGLCSFCVECAPVGS